MAKSSTFKFRLDEVDRKRLASVASSLSCTQATTIRILIKRAFDEFARTKAASDWEDPTSTPYLLAMLRALEKKLAALHPRRGATPTDTPKKRAAKRDRS